MKKNTIFALDESAFHIGDVFEALRNSSDVPVINVDNEGPMLWEERISVDLHFLASAGNLQ